MHHTSFNGGANDNGRASTNGTDIGWLKRGMAVAMRMVFVLAMVVLPVLAACSDSPTGPRSELSVEKPRASHWVCPSGWITPGVCGEEPEWCFDATFSSGAYCASSPGWCDPMYPNCDLGEGGGGTGPEPWTPALNLCTASEADLDAHATMGSGAEEWYDEVDPLYTWLVNSGCMTDLASKYRAWVLRMADDKACHGNKACLKLYERYMDGGDDYLLTPTECAEVAGLSPTLNLVTAGQFTIGNNLFYTMPVNTYGSKYGAMLGQGTAVYEFDGTFRGFYDHYNMDIRIRRTSGGDIAKWATIATAGAYLLPRVVSSPQSFRVYCGVTNPNM